MNVPATPTSLESLNLINVSIEKYQTIHFSVNFLVIILSVVLFILIRYIIQKIIGQKWIHRKVLITEAEIGLKDAKVKISCNAIVEEIAYKIWVELITRKIAIPVDKENDVIVEVYDSWNIAFHEIRKLLKEIPGKHLDNASDLITITTAVLNDGLRPHLTKWQAKYRKWYDEEKSKQESLRVTAP